MRLVPPLLLTALSLALPPALADTRATNDKPSSVVQQRASPAAPKTDEERTHSHSQPDVPTPGGTTPQNTRKADGKADGKAAAKGDAKKSEKAKKVGAQKGDKSSAAGGATAPAPSPEKEQAFRALDIDGDNLVSKAEAAGNEDVTVKFDRADRNRDGKLSAAEYERLDQPRGRTRTSSR